jgi:uncharacterized protein (TIGR03083 family)
MAIATTPDIWSAVRQEREALIADLETLSPEQWDAQSLCTEWKVRDVLGHLIGGIEAGPGSFMFGVLRSGFNMSRWLAADAKHRGAAPPADLLAQYRALVASQRTPPGAKPVFMLNDVVIHGQDIRRAVGIAHTFPAAHLETTLDSVRSINVLLGTARRIAGLRLQAIDVDWSTGSGPEVSGTGEALLMAMTGRTTALADLSGDGLAILRERMPKA